jgi:hypothetical protein
MKFCVYAAADITKRFTSDPASASALALHGNMESVIS